jgi:hypothetical protein
LLFVDLDLSQLPPLERYKLLIGLVIPRPIAWVSTWSENGVANCAPFSHLDGVSGRVTARRGFDSESGEPSF